MGFLGGLFSKKSSSDPLAALREKADANPADPKPAQDLANQLKAQGDVSGAQIYARQAAKAHRGAGFSQKALAILKGAVLWGDPTTELLQDLADLHLELKHKEDARGALIQLRKLHASAGNKSELGRIDAKLQELGPGR
jgi:thioredoxin-like negative regulator of GroEL